MKGFIKMDSQNVTSERTEPAAQVPSTAPHPPGDGLRAQIRNALLIVTLAMLAAVVAWLIGESTFNYFKASLAASENYRNPTALNQEMPGVNARNGALTYGVLGGLLGVALGAAGGLARRTVAGTMRGAIVGLVLGTLAGALPSIVLMPWQWRHRNDDPASLELLTPLLLHLGLWSAIGFAAGIAFEIGFEGFKPLRLLGAALAGLVGATLGIFMYEVAGAFLFPSDHTTDPFPGTSAMRLLARICLAGFIGVWTIRSVPGEKRSG
jgi:hypothetical protein